MSSIDAPACDKQCVFRYGHSWFALPVTAIREVTARPALVRVPKSDPILAGLCNERNEFLPVMRLPASPGNGSQQESQPNQMLLLSGPSGSWGLLVDHVEAIESLECSMDTEGYCDEWSSAVMGTSSSGDHVVRVLDPNGLYRLVEAILKRSWPEA